MLLVNYFTVELFVELYSAALCYTPKGHNKLQHLRPFVTLTLRNMLTITTSIEAEE